MRIMFTVVALGPVTCYTNGTGSQLTTVNKKRIILSSPFNNCSHNNIGDLCNGQKSIQSKKLFTICFRFLDCALTFDWYIRSQTDLECH